MNKEKLLSMAKTMKWAPIFIGVVAIVIGIFSLFVKTEDPEIKRGVVLFAILGVLGLLTMVFGLAISSLFEALAEAKTPEEKEDDDLDILA